jgi:cyclopropane-fatty-acyl-phospholipid synthase
MTSLLLSSRQVSSYAEARLAGLSIPVNLSWPGGCVGSSSPRVRLTLHHRSVLADLAEGRVGAIADAYVRGALDIEGELRDVMTAAAELAGDPVSQGAVPPWRYLLSLLRARGSLLRLARADQVRFHYDLGDDLFALWLDPRRVYSCAYYRDAAMSLAQAQEAKLDHICRKLGLVPGQRFLDIGAGWGGLLMWAAEHYGVRASGITLSRNQHAHVERLIDAKGLRGRVEIRLLDFHDLPADGSFDAAASVGMFEHVGRSRLDAYFARMARLVRPGGLIMNHGITAGGLDNRQLGAGIGEFIERHIFPGGELVHVAQVAQSLARAGLELLDAENLRPHYARTLWAWADGLEASRERAEAVAGPAVVRAYRMYLGGCAMAFEQGWMALYQLLATRPDGDAARGPMRGAQSAFPFNREYMYRASPLAGGPPSAADA